VPTRQGKHFPQDSFCTASAHVHDVHIIIAQDDAVPAHEGPDLLAGPELRRQLDVARFLPVLFSRFSVVHQFFLPRTENDVCHK
jgi:hypothetical protein